MVKPPNAVGMDPDNELYVRARYFRFVSVDRVVGIALLRELYERYRAVSNESCPMKVGITPVK